MSRFNEELISFLKFQLEEDKYLGSEWYFGMYTRPYEITGAPIKLKSNS
ncbi:hypothetical protein LCGC14_0547770 [marine sediment metagenome]|uniref:Uncharacterized protein n=1 Tax=marine sediment metagenome TaxID=412755 RepID=A0A0F9RQY4_9ZZZZ